MCYHYGEWQPLSPEIQAEYGVEFRRGLPSKEDEVVQPASEAEGAEDGGGGSGDGVGSLGS